MTIKTRIRIMRPGQPDEIREYDLEQEPGYNVLDILLDPLLDGADLERVAVLADFDGGKDFKPLDMFVDDIGRLKCLPRNEAATEHYGRATMLGRSGAPRPADPEDLPYIAGPAVLFDRRVWF